VECGVVVVVELVGVSYLCACLCVALAGKRRGRPVKWECSELSGSGAMGLFVGLF